MVSTFPNSYFVDLSRVRLAIRSLQPQLVEWRRRLHQQPELGFQEKLTAEFGELNIKQVLLKRELSPLSKVQNSALKKY
jgi:hypothetical protein